jgi:hypothetical protein
MSDRLDRLASLIRQLQGALDGKAIQTGTVTFTFTASTFSAVQTVSHGLGRTPVAVFVASWWLPGVADGFSPVKSTTFSGTTFECYGAAGPGYAAFTNSVTTTWIAVG